MAGDARKDPPESFINRELSWLSFARRVLVFVEDPEVPLLERVKFAGIVGMLHDEFNMKRISGLKRQVTRGSKKLSLDGRQPHEELAACRAELHEQAEALSCVLREDIKPALAREGIPILDYGDLSKPQRRLLREYFQESVQPILTPLAVDAEHPFPFISDQGLNLAVTFKGTGARERFVRIEVPGNRPRWVPLPDGEGFVPLEQVLAAHLDRMFPGQPSVEAHLFRVTRGAGADEEQREMEESGESRPGSLVLQVSHELKARRFAGVVRLQVEDSMPKKLVRWLAKQLDIGKDDIDTTDGFLGLKDLVTLAVPERESLRFRPHRPIVHPRLANLGSETSAIFEEIARGDILLHHPYHDFDSSVLRFLESAAADPQVLAIKLTIYRTSSESPIIQALVDAVRQGKQVAVVVEITARFDEAPNILWGKLLEKEGAHVAYGVERLKTHVKMAMVVREEEGRVRRYLHVGTGNYHTGTARLYEDVGILTCHAGLCEDGAKVFNSLTGAMPDVEYRHLIVAPEGMRRRFIELIRREAENAGRGRACGIQAKMNQLQDPQLIRELYAASQAGVPISLNVRGLCSLQPGVPGLSENIRVFSVVGRFLEHSRIYRFENAGEPECFLGSADWMKRNLDRRVETIAPVLDPDIREKLGAILRVYEEDNSSAWDCGPDGVYVRRTPGPDAEILAAQDVFSHRAKALLERDAEPQRSRTARPSAEDAPARTR